MKKIVGFVAAATAALTLGFASSASADVELTPSVACPAGTEASVAQLIDGVYVYDEADSDPLVSFVVNETSNVPQPQPDGSVVYTRFQVVEARAKGTPRDIVDVAINGEFVGYGAPQHYAWIGSVTSAEGSEDVTPIYQEVVVCTQA